MHTFSMHAVRRKRTEFQKMSAETSSFSEKKFVEKDNISNALADNRRPRESDLLTAVLQSV